MSDDADGCGVGSHVSQREDDSKGISSHIVQLVLLKTVNKSATVTERPGWKEGKGKGRSPFGEEKMSVTVAEKYGGGEGKKEM